MQEPSRPFSFPVIAIVLLFFSMMIPSGAVQAAGFDVSVSSKDISFSSSSSTLYAGDTIEITATIRNNGTTTNNVAVAFYLGSTLLDSKVLPVVPASATALGQWNTTGLGPGTYKINVTVVAQGDSNTTNNNANASVMLKKRPVAVLVIESLQVSPVTPIDGVVAYINGTIKDTGDANASLDTSFAVDNGTAVKRSLVISVGETKNVSMPWNTTGKEGNHTVVLTVGQAKKTVNFRVNHRPRAVFTVEKVWISDRHPTQGRSISVSALVNNTGDAPEEVIIVFKDNTKTWAKSKPKVFMPGEEHDVSADWSPGTGNHVLRIEVENHPEAMNFYSVTPTPLPKSGCGFQTIMPGILILGGCVGLVRWKGRRA